MTTPKKTNPVLTVIALGLVVGVFLLLHPLPAAAESSESTSRIEVPNPGSELWRDVRSRIDPSQGPELRKVPPQVLVQDLWQQVQGGNKDITGRTQSGGVDAGVLIHEGQLTFQDLGLVLLEDLGVWWAKETGGLPLPLGGNTVRRDLGDLIPQVSRLLRESIAYGLEHREESVEYSLQFGRDLNLAQADEFIGMYVNDRTLDYGDDGREAVRLFLERAHRMGLIPQMPELDFVR